VTVGLCQDLSVIPTLIVGPTVGEIMCTTLRQELGGICLDTFTVTKFSEAFSGKQMCQYIKMLRCFKDQLRLHLLGAR
jgi:hypothetical protein